MKQNLIRAKALGLIYRGPEILVSPVTESDGRIKGYRPAGGTVEFGELSATTLEREFMEEFAARLTNIRFLRVFENIFSYRGTPGHEIVFVYQADFADKAFYAREELVMLDAKPGDNPYIWLDPNKRAAGTEIFPTGLLG